MVLAEEAHSNAKAAQIAQIGLLHLFASVVHTHCALKTCPFDDPTWRLSHGLTGRSRVAKKPLWLSPSCGQSLALGAGSTTEQIAHRRCRSSRSRQASPSK